MVELLRQFVRVLSFVSVGISLVTYYLAANKIWQQKHERAVSASVSLGSHGLYLFIVIVNLLNLALTAGPWQTGAEFCFALMNSSFMVAVAIGWWVPGERSKGVLKLVITSLRTERQHLGALAKAVVNPAGSGKIIDILGQLAMIDGELDDREKAFVQVFADAWGVSMNWEKVATLPQLSTSTRFIQLRRDMEGYLALSPPHEQAAQLSDLITQLVNADDKVTEAEALISTELKAQLQQYTGGGQEPAVYEVHLVPQTAAEAEALITAFPQMERHVRQSGLPILVAATCYSRDYAEIVREQYGTLQHYAAVARRAPAAGNSSSPQAQPAMG